MALLINHVWCTQPVWPPLASELGKAHDKFCLAECSFLRAPVAEWTRADLIG